MGLLKRSREGGWALGAITACCLAIALMGLGPVADAAPRPVATLLAPVTEVSVVRLFDPPAQPWSPGHRGVDLRTEVGAVVLAPGDGVVTFAGHVVDRGVVTVTHSDGLLSSMEPVWASVTTGDVVVAGQALGVVADEPDHCPAATCLHWGIRDQDRYLNPLDWLVGFGPVRLLPLED